MITAIKRVQAAWLMQGGAGVQRQSLEKGWNSPIPEQLHICCSAVGTWKTVTLGRSGYIQTSLGAQCKLQVHDSDWHASWDSLHLWRWGSVLVMTPPTKEQRAMQTLSPGPHRLWSRCPLHYPIHTWNSSHPEWLLVPGPHACSCRIPCLHAACSCCPQSLFSPLWMSSHPFLKTQLEFHL